MKFLVIDTETGGLDPKKDSILSLAGIVLNTKSQLNTEFSPHYYSFIKEPYLRISPIAMEINNISMRDILNAPSPNIIWNQFMSWVNESFPEEGKIIIAGQNPSFDYGFLERLQSFDEQKTYSLKDFFTRRMLDTTTIGYMLMMRGILPSDFVPSLSNLGDWLAGKGKWQKDTVLHNAYTDAQLTAKLIQYAVDLEVL